jgi:hypothetical protein
MRNTADETGKPIAVLLQSIGTGLPYGLHIRTITHHAGPVRVSGWLVTTANAAGTNASLLFRAPPCFGSQDKLTLYENFNIMEIFSFVIYLANKYSALARSTFRPSALTF